MRQSIIFDMDGTLFETEPVALAAFHLTFEKLKKEGLYTGEIPSDDMMLKQLGKTMDQLWLTLIPGVEPNIRRLADEWMFQFEEELIRSRKGRLFPGVEEVLKELYARGYSLFVASNGRPDYVRAILETFQVIHLFTGLYTAVQYQTKTKVDLVRLLLEEYPADGGYMVGDRESDVEAGKENGLTVVGCRFGYANEHELEKADYVISSMKELLSLLA